MKYLYKKLNVSNLKSMDLDKLFIIWQPPRSNFFKKFECIRED